MRLPHLSTLLGLLILSLSASFVTAISYQYVGCYTAPSNANMPLVADSASMTPDLCFAIAIAKSSTVTAFAVRATQCFAGALSKAQSYSKSTQCNFLCPGNSSQTCGGSDGLLQVNSLFKINSQSNQASPPPATLKSPKLKPSPPSPSIKGKPPPKSSPPPLIRISPSPPSQLTAPPPSNSIDSSLYSRQLFASINSLRVSLGLSSIPHSSSLQLVADTHTMDLAANYMTKASSKCIPHSWYSGPFACCYDIYNTTVENYSCMWDKPKQLTNNVYSSSGYEIMSAQVGQGVSLGSSSSLALAMWKSSSPHYSVITSKAPWNVKPWKALACSISTVPSSRSPSKGDFYAVCWFGFDSDPVGYYL